MKDPAFPAFYVKQPVLTMATEPVERQRHDAVEQ